MNRKHDSRPECAVCEVTDFGDFHSYGLFPGRVFTLRFRYPRATPPRWLISLMGTPEDRGEEATEVPKGFWKAEDVSFRVLDSLPLPAAGWLLETCQHEILGWGACEQRLVVMVVPEGDRRRGIVMTQATWRECYVT